ncbi:DMT family transporter [Aquibaculum arenosum]|uniref:DMT family transporter n=1 Tax=Aquibaculum arenosum TaxID=3032591 RepID=A0ABT5YKU1_9PROT|nr:DMT family transporter [Fodinicurvata sp. CAU 1616]MDF2095565.1 DMT family transporter [Fodinicurvata sp. CAU 1616]
MSDGLRHTYAALRAGRAPAGWVRLGGNERGALWMLLAALGFTLNAAFAKTLAQGGMPVFQIAFARAFFALAPLLPFLLAGGLVAFRTRHPGTHLLRALFGAGAMISGFYALSTLPLATVTVLTFTVPLFAVVLSVLLLGEQVRWRRWTATLTGFGGVVIMTLPSLLQDGGFVLEWALLAGLGQAFGIAMSVVLVKRVPASESQPVMVFWFCLASIILTAPLALMQWITPSQEQWILLAAVGVTGFVSQSLIIKAYRSGEASFVAPFDYAKLPIAVLAGWLAFAELPDWATYLGGAIVVGSTLYIARREARPAEGSRF